MNILSVVRYILLSSLMTLLICMYPVIASASLSAEVSLDYTNYSVTDNQANHLSSHSLTQNYSLLYSHQGVINNERFAKYSVALGYNWSALDTRIASNVGHDDISTSRGHVFYRGELVVDPKELPLRITAYSRDVTRNTFSTTESDVMNKFFTKNSGYLLGNPGLATDINDGVHIDTGITMIAGVKNGMTNGYNEILRHFPMIMLDYKDQIDRDLRAKMPIDTRLTRLAFVSLNKKDNWFHYRYVTYDDRYNPSNNYTESQVQIGTIDQTLTRKWIDFSNWLRVSTDILFTKRLNDRLSENYEEVDLNLFSTARRSKWEASLYGNFNRYREESGLLNYRTTLPLYASGTPNPDMDWSTRTAYKDTRDNTGAFLTSTIAGYRIDAFKRAPFTLSQTFDVESSGAEHADMLVLAGGLETTSSERLSRVYRIAASYNIKGTSLDKSGTTSDFLEQKLSFQGYYNPLPTFKLSLRQENEFTNGRNANFSSSVRDSSTMLPQYVAPRSSVGGVSDLGAGHTYHSVSSLTAIWNPLARLYFNLTASNDLFYTSDSSSNRITSVRASADYSSAKVRFTDTLNYTDGSYQIGQKNKTLTNSASLIYYHSRNLDSRLTVAYSRLTDQYGTSYSTDAEQQLTYSYYSYVGLARKIFEVNEMLTYSNSPYSVPLSFSSTSTITSSGSTSQDLYSTANAYQSNRGSFSLGYKYFPLRQLVFSGGARYQFEKSLSNYSLLWYSSLGASYRLFQATLDYYQGKRQSDGLLEKKFTANFKKMF